MSEPNVRATTHRGVNIVTLPCDNPIQSNSTGVVIDDRTVVTVAHALFGSRDVALLDSFGRWHRPEIIRLDLEKDLAVLRVEGLRGEPLPLAPRGERDEWIQRPVRILDASASGTFDATILRRVELTTAVIGDRSTDSARLGYEVAADIAPGDSGAAIVDEAGRLAGLVFSRSTSQEGISWATAASEIDLRPAPVPAWDCGPGTGRPLELRPPMPTRLAG